MAYVTAGASMLVNAPWRTSSYTASNQACVEVAPLLETVAVRDSKMPGGPVLVFSAAAFDQCVAAIG
ncbi:DUF397 domain-containing protein [Embleya sp. MST-111070]|uniref:DUF397 domain-containing protein n=1 Tax=Embleya sp. MST-111070 TaxID=3398231 RepID=UPI003F733FC1